MAFKVFSSLPCSSFIATAQAPETKGTIYDVSTGHILFLPLMSEADFG